MSETRSISLIEAKYDDGTIRIAGSGKGDGYKVFINEEEVKDITQLAISFYPESVPVMSITRRITPKVTKEASEEEKETKDMKIFKCSCGETFEFEPWGFDSLPVPKDILAWWNHLKENPTHKMGMEEAS